MARHGFNERQARFVAEYVIDLNAGKAAKRAGYSAHTADRMGHALLKKPEIADLVAHELRKREARTAITQDRVLQELALLAFSDVEHYYLGKRGRLRVRKSAPRGASRAISSVKYRTTTDVKGNKTHEVEYRLWNKPDPLKLAGLHAGLAFAPKLDPDNDKPTTIVVNTHCTKPPEVVAAEEAAEKEGT